MSEGISTQRRSTVSSPRVRCLSCLGLLIDGHPTLALTAIKDGAARRHYLTKEKSKALDAAKLLIVRERSLGTSLCD
jgi:hypothetical protein